MRRRALKPYTSKQICRLLISSSFQCEREIPLTYSLCYPPHLCPIRFKHQECDTILNPGIFLCIKTQKAGILFYQFIVNLFINLIVEAVQPSILLTGIPKIAQHKSLPLIFVYFESVSNRIIRTESLVRISAQSVLSLLATAVLSNRHNDGEIINPTDNKAEPSSRQPSEIRPNPIWIDGFSVNSSKLTLPQCSLIYILYKSYILDFTLN